MRWARRHVALSVVVVAAVALPVAALAEQAYTDPTGDSGQGPDIVGVTVTNDLDNAVRFAIKLSGAAELPANASLLLLVDTDANYKTGNQEGAEVAVVLDGESQRFSYARWDGTKMDDAATTTLTELAFRPGEVVVGLPTIALNRSTSFDFWVYSAAYLADAKVGGDSAPDGSDVYSYSLEIKAVTLKGAKPSSTPPRPVAGGRFFVSMVVTRADDGARISSGTVQCVARIGTKKLIGKGTILNGVLPRCTFAIPPKTSGRVLRGTIVVAVPGGSVARPFSYKIL